MTVWSKAFAYVVLQYDYNITHKKDKQFISKILLEINKKINDLNYIYMCISYYSDNR